MNVKARAPFVSPLATVYAAVQPVNVDVAIVAVTAPVCPVKVTDGAVRFSLATIVIVTVSPVVASVVEAVLLDATVVMRTVGAVLSNTTC